MESRMEQRRLSGGVDERLNLDLDSHVGGDALTRVRANWRFIPHPLNFFDQASLHSSTELH
jgi:hypothetical protein